MIKANKEDGFLTKVGRTLKSIIGRDLAAHVRAGYRNSDLSLTSKGQDAVLEHYAATDEVKAHLTTLAKEDIKEIKGKKCADSEEEEDAAK